MASSKDSVDNILTVLTEADRFSGSDQLEKLKLLAMAVVPYSLIEDPTVGVVEIYRRIKERHEDSAPAIITRLVDKAGFKKSIVSKLSRIPSCETPPMPLLYFAELLVEISDDLGHTDYLRRLKNRIPDSQLGASREGISTSVQLFKLLLFEKTISFDEEIKSLKLLSEWMCDVGRRDIASKIMSCAEEKEEVKQSALFSWAEKTGGVPFLHHHLLECDSTGNEWINMEHDITLRIPEGAVAEGEKIHFEIGVAMYGPFIFPDNTRPISPILWLCLLEESIVLKKPFQVVLPHYLTGLPKERVQYHQVGFAKANHKNVTFVDAQTTFKFENSEIEPVLASSGCRSYGVLISKHCCLFCLKANHTPELAKDAGYCLTRIDSFLTPQRNEVYFSVTYFLETCLRSLDEQFAGEAYQISRTDIFKFKDGTEPLLIEPIENDQCVVTMEPSSAKIKPSDVDFWSFRDTLQLRHKRGMYPPRVKMTIMLRNPDEVIKLPIKFSGHADDAELDVELAVPLGFPSINPISSMSTRSGQSCSHIICCPPKLKDVFGELLPLAAKWKNIGVLLDIPVHILDKIQSDEDGVDNCLREMLSQWQKLVDLPTWKDLADAVDKIDKQKSTEIREKYGC